MNISIHGWNIANRRHLEVLIMHYVLTVCFLILSLAIPNVYASDKFYGVTNNLNEGCNKFMHEFNLEKEKYQIYSKYQYSDKDTGNYSINHRALKKESERIYLLLNMQWPTKLHVNKDLEPIKIENETDVGIKTTFLAPCSQDDISHMMNSPIISIKQMKETIFSKDR